MDNRQWVRILSLVRQVLAGEIVRADRRLEDGTQVLVYKQGDAVTVMIRPAKAEVSNE